ANGRTLRALVHYELGDYGAAADDALRALALPGLPAENVGAAHLVLARVYVARGQWAEATSYFNAVQTLGDPVNARAARIGLELLSALPQSDGVGLNVADAGDGFVNLDLGNLQVRFQYGDGISPAAAHSVALLLQKQLDAIGQTTGTRFEGPLQLVIYK